MRIAEIEFFLRGELGTNAEILWQDRTVPSPLNLVLDQVDAQLKANHRLCWAYRATPELMCFPDFDPAVVLYSSRFVELCGLLRSALMGPFVGKLKQEVIERLLLKTVAELALRHGDPEFAVEAFLKSAVHQGILIMDSDKLADLEIHPKNAAYMGVWFYGLVHEYGHLQYAANRDRQWQWPFSNEAMAEALDVALEAANLPELEKAYARRRAHDDRQGFCLGLEHLREEGMADIFAASVLLASTSEVMAQVGLKFELVFFLQELTLARTYVFAMRQCQLLARLDRQKHEERMRMELGYESAFLSVSLHVRALMQRKYLEVAVAGICGEPTEERRQEATEFIEAAEAQIVDVIQSFNDAYDSVTRYVVQEAEREQDGWELLEQFRLELLSTRDRVPQMFHARPFVALAEGLGVRGKLRSALKRVVSNPVDPIKRDLAGDLAFVVPFVVGHGMRRPFGLDTRHGHVVFVFAETGALFKTFVRESANGLREGFVIKTALIPVSRPEKLGRRLAGSMPEGLEFTLFVQGTPLFDRMMEELASGTIWPSSTDSEAPPE